MPLRRTGARRTSEQNVALVQMQIAAQARNQRWHDFLCAKRDDLQARLRQQGYSSQPGPPHPRADDAPGFDSEEAREGKEGTEVEEVADRDTRWGVPEQAETRTDTDGSSSRDLPEARSAEALDWWNDESGS